MGESFKIITLGCKVNQYESSYIRECLVSASCFEAHEGERAGITVVNTCLVTQRAAHQSRQEIRKAVREASGGVVAVTGCYAQMFPQELGGIEGVAIVAGNKEKSRLAELILNFKGHETIVAATGYDEAKTDFEFLPIRRFSERTRAFLKIQDGCRSFCSYCIVPYARGPYRSLAPEKVLEMIEAMEGEGYREIVLTGIHLGKYGVDLSGNMDLCGLLRDIGKRRRQARIRLSSIEPNEVAPSLIDMMASELWLCRHLHIPLQSGDERILGRMNRRYSARDFESLIQEIRNAVPLAALGVDVMTGFPGEGRSSHRNTVSLLERLPVSYLHVFPFSPREGTPAASFGGRVEPAEIKERSAELRELGARKRRLFSSMCVGETFDVVVEGPYHKCKGYVKGTSDNYLQTVFPCAYNSTGQLVSVRMDGIAGNLLEGSVL